MIKLTTLSAPSIPSFTIITNNATSIGFSGVGITNFDRFNVSYNGTSDDTNLPNGTDTSHDIEGLTPGTVYDVIVDVILGTDTDCGASVVSDLTNTNSSTGCTGWRLSNCQSSLINRASSPFRTAAT